MAHLIDGSQVVGDGPALGFVDEDALEVVVARVAQQGRLLADAQEAALHRRHLWRHCQPSATPSKRPSTMALGPSSLLSMPFDRRSISLAQPSCSRAICLF